MSTRFNPLIKKLIIQTGIASASVLLSLPALTLINQPFKYQTTEIGFKGEIGELLAQGSSGDAGDEGLNNEQLPRIDITNDEQPQTDSNNNQQSPATPSGENTQPNNSSSGSENTGRNGQYSTNQDRLKPGSWACVNNPNPACNS